MVAVQDADDWSDPRRLERQLEVLEARPDVAVVGSRMPEVDANGRELTARAPFAAGDAYHVLMRFNPISNPSSAYRRDVVMGLGGYDPRYGCAPEYDLWLRVSDHHVVLALDEALAIRTLDGENLSTVRERICVARLDPHAAARDAAQAQPAGARVGGPVGRVVRPPDEAQARAPAQPRSGSLRHPAAGSCGRPLRGPRSRRGDDSAHAVAEGPEHVDRDQERERELDEERDRQRVRGGERHVED